MNTISVIASLEVQSAIQRRLRLGELTKESAAAAISKLNSTLPNFTLTLIDAVSIHAASLLIQRHSLRALDAIHLAASLSVRDAMNPGESLLFIASDQRLLAAAKSEGFATWNPADSADLPAPPVN